MTPEALKSWRAWQTPLSDSALAALHRGLTNGDPDAANPIVYALHHGDGLRGIRLQSQYDEVHWQANRALHANLLLVVEWQLWFDTQPRTEAYAGLAAAVADEMERRRLARGVPASASMVNKLLGAARGAELQ